jgi:hypothetical protein
MQKKFLPLIILILSLLFNTQVFAQIILSKIEDKEAAFQYATLCTQPDQLKKNLRCA